MPVVALMTARLHGIARADEKVLALGMAILFGSITLACLARLAKSAERGETFGVESHWGGLGGGVGGWRISAPLGYFVCAVTFGALMGLAVSLYSVETRSRSDAKQADQARAENAEVAAPTPEGSGNDTKGTDNDTESR
jgi:hypothetical protein